MVTTLIVDDCEILSSDGRLNRLLARIDERNAQDPHRETEKGESLPAALLYGRRMTTWLQRLVDQPPAPLQIAARAQHIGRWNIPRSDYPATREGYLAWRSVLYRLHADEAAALMAEAGYDGAAIEQVRKMLMKRGLKQDPDVQLIEDVACLVFLEHYFPDFAERHEADKIVDILKKTWRKMSPRGHQAALGIEMPEALAKLVDRALAALA